MGIDYSPTRSFHMSGESPDVGTRSAGANILVLSFSDQAQDPRVNRQLRFLSPYYRVTAAGWSDPRLVGVDFIPVRTVTRSLGRRIAFGIPRRLRAGIEILTRHYDEHYWKRPEVRHCMAQIRERGLLFDLVLANDIECLPIALALDGHPPVLYDAHEFAPGMYEDRLMFRLFWQAYNLWLCRTFMPAARVVTTVSQGIANAYAPIIGCPPHVIWNAPDPEDLAPTSNKGRIRLVHHGLADRSRRIEQMIYVMNRLDRRFELSLILVGDDHRYVEALRRQVRSNPRISVLPRVEMRSLPRFLNQFDVGLYLLPDSNRNHVWALPNKFFEFVQARLAVAISPNPEMAHLVRAHDLGVVADGFDPGSLARELATLDANRVAHFKQRSHLAAQQLGAAPQRERLLALVRSILGY